MLHLRLLGPLLVEDGGGQDLTPPGARERAGLVTLAVVSPEALSTERLVAELYRERDTTDPRNAVQAMVSRLRRGLGRSAGSIETTTNGYRLVDASLDVDEAERLLRASMATDDDAEAATLLEAARALWHGPTLDGLSGELIDAERVRLDDLRADAEDRALERRMSLDDDLGLVEALEQAVRDQPLREARWELLMLALYRSGRQTDALRAFQRARTLLSNHLGLEPGPRLATLEARILSHDPELTDADPRRPTGPGNDEFVAEAEPADPNLPTGTVTVLLCDVEGSVRQWESAPTDTSVRIEELHQRWATAVDGVGGHLVKSTGDGVLAAFGTAAAAVQAAATAMSQQEATGLSVRAAINTGALTPTAEGDYRGSTVNRCARLLEVANGGQILVTGTAAELAAGELASSPGQQPTLRRLGAHHLRDVPEAITIWQVEDPRLPSAFPRLAASADPRLPRRRTELFGRQDLLADLTERVADNRLVTLLGPGGIGKTSLATAVAWSVAGTRPVAFVDLARVTDGGAVGDRLADAVVRSDHDIDQDPIDRVVDRLSENTDLVVIDNAEHLLDSVAEVVDRVLAYEIKASFLITSRNPLGLPDEVIIGVPPLDLPTNDTDLDATGRSPSVQLFIERARAVRPDFELPNGLLPVVAHICRRLDGIPLAIELAAGRASLLSIEDIASLLDDQIRLLRQVRSGRDRRHRSLEAVVRWSVDQLSPDGREAFARLAPMAGDFGLDGAGAVFAHCGLSSIDVLEVLDELHGASLLAVEADRSRFKMLEPIRQSAMAELTERGLEDETRRAHARWMIDLVGDAHRRRDETRAVSTAKVDEEAAHLRAALAWIGERQQTDLAREIGLDASWWFLTREAVDGERLLTKLQALVDPDTDRAGWAILTIGVAVVTAAQPYSPVVDEIAQALEVLDELDHPDRGIARIAAAFARASVETDVVPLTALVAEAEELIDPNDRFAMALVDLATVSLASLAVQIDLNVADFESAVARGWRAAEEFTALDQNWALGVTLSQQGLLLRSLDRIDEAEACYRRSLDLFSDEQYHGTHYIHTELGMLASQRGAHDEAARHHASAVRVAEADGSKACLAGAVAGLGHAAEARGDLAEALDRYRHALRLSSSSSLTEHGRADWLSAVARLESLVDGES